MCILIIFLDQSPSWEVNSSHLIKKFLSLYGTQRFITVLTTACFLTLTWARLIHSTPSQPVSLRYILILASYLCLGVIFPHQNPVCISLPPYAWCMPCSSYPPWLDHLHNICWRVQIMKVFIVQLFPSPITSTPWAQISSSLYSSQTSAACILPLVW